jgi:methyltransferase (TIGR00027 family)
MKEDCPSTTADRVAMRRAAHQLLDDPRVFEDPIALRIIDVASAAALQSDPQQFEAGPLTHYLRAFVAARSRYAEDLLAQAVQRGVRQYVVLGAGLDTFAYRNPYPAEALRVFEVDHPATQAWKRSRLDEGGIAVPQTLSFAPVDFERQTLADGLRSAGFKTGEPSFFSWLGVTPYLSLDAVMATLTFIASSAGKGGGVVFDYAIPATLLTTVQRLVFDALAQRVKAAGEPFQTFFDPVSLAATLKAMGFGRVEDMGGDAINERYFKGRKDGLKVGSLGRLMMAQVG